MAGLGEMVNFLSSRELEIAIQSFDCAYAFKAEKLKNNKSRILFISICTKLDYNFLISNICTKLILLNKKCSTQRTAFFGFYRCFLQAVTDETDNFQFRIYGFHMVSNRNFCFFDERLVNQSIFFEEFLQFSFCDIFNHIFWFTFLTQLIF